MKKKLRRVKRYKIIHNSKLKDSLKNNRNAIRRLLDDLRRFLGWQRLRFIPLLIVSRVLWFKKPPLSTMNKVKRYYFSSPVKRKFRTSSNRGSNANSPRESIPNKYSVRELAILPNQNDYCKNNDLFCFPRRIVEAVTNSYQWILARINCWTLAESPIIPMKVEQLPLLSFPSFPLESREGSPTQNRDPDIVAIKPVEDRKDDKIWDLDTPGTPPEKPQKTSSSPPIETPDDLMKKIYENIEKKFSIYEERRKLEHRYRKGLTDQQEIEEIQEKTSSLWNDEKSLVPERKELLNKFKGISIEHVDQDGRNLAHILAEFGMNRTLREFIRDTSPSMLLAENNFGMTPLQCAMATTDHTDRTSLYKTINYISSTVSLFSELSADHFSPEIFL